MKHRSSLSSVLLSLRAIVKRTAARRLGRAGLHTPVSDVTQAALLTIWKKRNVWLRMTTEQRERYARAVAKNEIRVAVRRRRRSRESASPSAIDNAMTSARLSSIIVRRELQAKALEVLEDLPAELNATVRAYVDCDLNCAQTAQRLEMSASGVRERVRKAFEILRQRLERCYEAGGRA